MTLYDTKVSDMTVGELLAVIDEHLGRRDNAQLFGLSGLSEFLGCSLRTAQELKSSGRLDGTYIQVGRKIVFDRGKVERRLK